MKQSCSCCPGVPLMLACVALLGVAGFFALQTKSPPVQADETKAEVGKLEKGKSDLPMFGGTPSRNMVNMVDKDIPGKFSIEGNMKWKSQLGSRAYGGPIIASGHVLCSTNNENPRNKRDRLKPAEGEELGNPIDKGVLMCFKESDGSFVWQAVHDKLESGQVHDWPHIGICSTPFVDGDRVYYVSNRCTVVCADLHGFANGNDGFQGEKYKDKTDVDIIWEYDMMKELNVFPHNIAACCPLIVDDFVFVITANGADENHTNIPSPEAPSFLTLSKKSGKMLWKSDAPGKNIMHGQWSNATYGVIKERAQVIFPGGDGWLRSYKPDTGELLWKFDANPKDSKYDLGGKGTRSDFIGTPVIYKDQVFIGTGQDPEHFEGIGHFWCIDATKTGDISPDIVTDAQTDPPKTKPNPNSGAVWHFGGKETRTHAKRDYVFGRTMSTACIVDDVIYIGELAGYLHCLDFKTGKRFWQYDLKSAIWGSAYYVDGKVFIGNEDGDLFVFRHDPKPESLDEVEIASQAADEKAAGILLKQTRAMVTKKYLISQIAIDEPIRSTPVVANGTLYIMTEKTIFAIGGEKK